MDEGQAFSSNWQIDQLVDYKEVTVTTIGGLLEEFEIDHDQPDRPFVLTMFKYSSELAWKEPGNYELGQSFDVHISADKIKFVVVTNVSREVNIRCWIYADGDQG